MSTFLRWYFSKAVPTGGKNGCKTVTSVSISGSQLYVSDSIHFTLEKSHHTRPNKSVFPRYSSVGLNHWNTWTTFPCPIQSGLRWMLMKCAHLHRPIKVTNPSISQTPARTPPGNKQLGFNRTEEEENQDVADQIWSSTSLCQSDSLWWWTVTAPVCPDRGCVSDSLTSDRQCPLKSNHLGTGQPDIINQPTWRTIWTFTSQKAQKKHWCNVKEIWITCLYNVSSEISTVKQEFFLSNSVWKWALGWNLQLSRSSIHSCSSMGYLVRSMSQATVDVILERD